MNCKTHGRFTGVETFPILSEHLSDLFSEQTKTWKKLRDAYKILKTLKTRAIHSDGFSVLLYHNPGRLTSANAAVGQKDIEGRPCFLCLHNLPGEQKGILYRESYMILYNPMPVFPGHLTVAHVGHQPQSISGHFSDFLSLAADLGETWIALYNGPRCGASAPDHLHFQALPRGRMPIERAMGGGIEPCSVVRVEDVLVSSISDVGRVVILLEGKNRGSMVHVFSKILVTLNGFTPSENEPMMNIAGFHAEETWRVALFPRKKHRPDAFFREGAERVLVSPGAVEMAGILITPLERDFERLDAKAIEDIYQEVSLDRDSVVSIIEALK
jgi:hypothetical protein